jgi:hypothetical protein
LPRSSLLSLSKLEGNPFLVEFVQYLYLVYSIIDQGDMSGIRVRRGEGKDKKEGITRKG